MNKRVLFIILVLLGVNVAALILLPQTTTLMDRKDLHIAVAVPLSGPESARGREVLNGIRLYLDRVASEGLLGNKRVKLVPYDDRKDRKTALHIATRIVEENKALLVLGHFYSSSAAIAGTVYRKRGIPAITGSATVSAALPGSMKYRLRWKA
jgi:branched-chain amino acid transport system substrate-binding protein